MPVLIAPGLNRDDGAQSAPTAHIGEPTLPSGGGVGQRRHSCPAPTPPQLHSPDPRRPHLGRGVNIHLKNCFLNQVARCVLCSGKKIVKKRYEEGHCVLHSSLRKEVHRGTLREAPSMPEYISPPVPALAAVGPSRCQGHGPLHFLKVRPLGGWDCWYIQ